MTIRKATLKAKIVIRTPTLLFYQPSQILITLGIEYLPQTTIFLSLYSNNQMLQTLYILILLDQII